MGFIFDDLLGSISFWCFTLNKCIFYWSEQVKKLSSKMIAKKKDNQKQQLRVLPGKKRFVSALSLKTNEGVQIPSWEPISLLKRKV